MKRTKQEINSDLADVDLEMRALLESVKDESKEFNAEEVRSKKLELTEKRSALCKELAELEKPIESRIIDGSGLYNRDAWIQAAREHRSLEIGTIGAAGIGSVNQLSELFKEISEGDDILQTARYFYGRDASTNIPVLSPMGEPGDYNEAMKPATGNTKTTIKEDTDTEINITEIQPKAHAIILPVTAEMLTMGSVNLEAELGGIFAQAFRRKMHNGMLTGSGTGKLMKGIYTSAKVTTANHTKITAAKGVGVTISELAKLALSVIGKSETYTLLMNPSVYQTLLSDSTSSEDVKIYKEGLIRDKSIEGVKIRLDNLMTAGTVANEPLVVAVPLSRYAIGIANQLVIDPIKVKGDTQTYFQATMFFSGKQISDKDLYSLVVTAAANS